MPRVEEGLERLAGIVRGGDLMEMKIKGTGVGDLGATVGLIDRGFSLWQDFAQLR